MGVNPKGKSSRIPIISQIHITMKATEILAKSQAATASLIQKGTKGHKESIYKASIFEGLSDKEKKASRKKIRNYVQSLLSSICTAEGESLKTLCKEFTDFYQEVYAVNDYSFASLASENTKEETKKAITAALLKVQEFNTPTPEPKKNPSKKGKK